MCSRANIRAIINSLPNNGVNISLERVLSIFDIECTPDEKKRAVCALTDKKNHFQCDIDYKILKRLGYRHAQVYLSKLAVEMLCRLYDCDSVRRGSPVLHAFADEFVAIERRKRKFECETAGKFSKLYTPILYTYRQGGSNQLPVRVCIDSADVLWFVAEDIGAILSEFKETNQTLRKIQYNEKMQMGIASRDSHTIADVINEAGLYRLLCSSDSYGSLIFKEWVTNTLLPRARSSNINI